MAINLKKGVKAPVKETVVLSQEEQNRLTFFKAYKNYLGEQINEARDKEELIDILEWLVYKVKTYDRL